MTSPQPQQRRARRLSRPDSERFFTVMLVFSHRTFRWSLARRTLLWTVGLTLGLTTVAMIGSAYGLWATRKIMSFGQLQDETQQQQRQLRESLNQAEALEGELTELRKQVSDLLVLLNPKAPGPDLPPVPSQSGGNATPNKKISQLRLDLERTTAQAQAIKARMGPILHRWSHTPSIPPTAGYLSSGFGIRISPFSRANEAGDGLLGYHTGLDITNAEGTPIQASADGEVTFAGWGGRYGWMVLIQHSDELQTLYAHLNQIKVKEGQRVDRGDILGGMGRSGNATGVHLHYEVRRNGSPVNPTPYLRLQRQWLSNLR